MAYNQMSVFDIPGDTVAFMNEPRGAILTLEDAVAITDPLLEDVDCVKETTQIIRALEDTDPSFFAVLVDGTQGLAATPGVQHPHTLSNTARTNMDDISAGNFCLLIASTPHMEPQVQWDPRRPYRCAGCGKLHDRRDRASDCENAKHGLKPYECRGRCGKQACNKTYASEQLINRHWSPENERVTMCNQCRRNVCKQNFSRHRKVCLAKSTT